MGSPISPAVAEIFLQNLENLNIPRNPDIAFWRRYVDDILAIVKGRKKKKILDSINNHHKDIQFTMEEEIDGILGFLDIQLYEKPDRSIGHQVKRKVTSSNKYMGYGSYHPEAHKLGVIDTLLRRAFILSDEDHVQEELIFVEEVLQENGYPINLIRKRKEIVKQKIATLGTEKIQRNPERRIILPYAGDVTMKMARYLRTHLDVEIGYFPGIKLSTILCNSKNKPKKIRCGVYSIQCKDCPSIYIGESGRDFMERISEHERDIRNGHVMSIRGDEEFIHSPVALHMIENDHQLNSASYKLLTIEPRKYFRRFKETLYIASVNNKMNISRGMIVNSIWCETLSDFFKNQKW